MTAAHLATLAERWNRRWLGAALALAAATALLAAVTAARHATLGPARGAVVGLAIGGLAFAALRRRRPRVDARHIARHLDRTVPALEDSTELLVSDDAALSRLERLQRDRVRATLDRLPEPALPHRPSRRAARIGLALLAAAAALALWPAPGTPHPARSAAPVGPRRIPAGAPPAPSVGAVEIAITPPRYTARGPRHAMQWDLDNVEEGARVTWRVSIRGPVARASLVTTAGDSIPLRAVDGDHFSVSLIPTTSRLYQIVATGPGGRTATPYHRLLVVADAAPTVTVVQPDLRTTVPTGAVAVAIEVLAHDDYGLRDAALVATVTSGQGEGVKFREQYLAFDRRDTRPGGGWRLRRSLELSALGLGPGDELYFHVAVHDTREPAPNETRSETHFVVVADTASPPRSDFSGVALDVLPEYFRSQRQIIIDTERLLDARPRITPQQFRDRSQNIGLDQHLLRLRYGEIVGDETVIDAPLGVDAEGSPEVHEHDTEDNATRLARSVKETLKAALGEMWSAELHLRTYDPERALPYEYRALELLKEVQQSARVYVQRTGFAPPPLEPDRNRLTGELTDIRSRSASATRLAVDSLPAVRAGIAHLDELDRRGAPTAPHLLALEAAGREIARLAADDPARHLETLGALRTLITALERDGSPCVGCVTRVRHGLWMALPSPAAMPTPERGPRDGVARRYFDLLGSLP